MEFVRFVVPEGTPNGTRFIGVLDRVLGGFALLCYRYVMIPTLRREPDFELGLERE